MTHPFALPDGRTIHVGMEGPGQFVSWIDGEDLPVLGWPLSGVIAEVIGLNPTHDELPDWVEPFAENVVVQLRVSLLDDEWSLANAESLRDAPFVHARWEPPPPEWVSADRGYDGRYGAMSMRAAPGPPSWDPGDPPAWDHDHCEICMQRLTDDPSYDDGEAAGWRTGRDWGDYRWVCDGCFRAFEDALGWTRALPPSISRLAAELAELAGVVAVVLGGSRATATQRPDSDWDLGVYYRGSQRPLDPADLRRLGYPGYVSELGEWGPIVNGGAWLTVEDTPVDVLLRDLDTVEGWLRDAEDGRFEVLAQNGYVVGAPTYLPVGELAVCQPISGDLPRASFPDRLLETAPERWKGRASVALTFAQGYAAAGDAVCCIGMLSNAVLCVAHARLARRREWALNEKRLVQRAQLDDAHALLARAGATASELRATVAAVSDLLRVAPLTIR